MKFVAATGRFSGAYVRLSAHGNQIKKRLAKNRPEVRKSTRARHGRLRNAPRPRYVSFSVLSDRPTSQSWFQLRTGFLGKPTLRHRKWWFRFGHLCGKFMAIVHA